MREKNQAALDEVRQKLSIQLLGGFSVSADDKPISEESWRLRKAKNLVKLLALAPDHRLHRDQVINTLWPDAEPKAGANAFYQALHAARRALDPSGTNEQCYLSLHSDYLSLCSDLALTIDVQVFEKNTATARKQQSLQDYRAALACYPGDLLPEDLYEEWAQPSRDALRGEYLRVLIEFAKLLEKKQDLTAAVETLRKVITLDKTHEEAHTLLMRLYMQMGQRRQAINQFKVLKTALQNELGIEPDAAATRLYQEILSERLAAESQPLRSTASSAPWHNLPARLTSFVGREKEMAEVLRLVAHNRLVTLAGVGGVGKTRLAIESIWRLLDGNSSRPASFPDGCWLVELSEISDPVLIPAQIAAILRVQEEPGRPLLDTLKNDLRGKQTLLILDNCEHVIEECACLVQDFLRRCPRLQILATSRQVLGSEGELVFFVPSLTLPAVQSSPTLEGMRQSEAVQLFLERAEVSPNFRLRPENAGQIADICKQLDGIPLAIELAAARAGVLGVEQIALHLDDRFRLLAGGSRTAIPRHQTMRACLDWSYELLSAQEQAILRRLSVFSGGWTFEAAEAVCVDAEVMDLLTHLVQKSLVVLGPDEDQRKRKAIGPRYMLLETVRQYALEKLVLSGKEGEIRDRHLDFYHGKTEKARPKTAIFEYIQGFHELSMELGNIRTALNWAAQAGNEGQLAKGLWLASTTAMTIRGVSPSEALAWLKPGLERLEGKAEWMQVRAQALLVMCLRMDFGQNKLQEAIHLAEKSAALFEECGDRAGLGWAKIELGGLYVHFDYERSIQSIDAGYALSRQVGDEWNMALARAYKANALTNNNQLDDAVACLVECQKILTKLHDHRNAIFALQGLAFVAVYRGEFLIAADYIEHIRQILPALDDQDAETQKHYIHYIEALLAYRQGEFLSMEQHVQAMVDYSTDFLSDSGLWMIYCLRLLGIAVKRQGDWMRAAKIFRKSIEMAQLNDDTYGVLGGLAGWGGSVALAGQELLAANILGAVKVLFERFTKPMDIIDKYDFDWDTGQIQQAVGAEEFARAWEKGRQWQLDQVLECVFESELP